jgi:hypothetical protein
MGFFSLYVHHNKQIYFLRKPDSREMRYIPKEINEIMKKNTIGRADFDVFKCDMYSFAVVLLDMMCLGDTFGAETIDEQIKKHSVRLVKKYPYSFHLARSILDPEHNYQRPSYD